jgi:hypothetical protein
MANFQVKDAYGSVITIQSSTFGSAERQAVAAYIMNAGSVSGTVGASVIGLTPVNVVGSVYGTVNVVGNPSISGTVNIGNAPSVYGNISGSVVGFQGGAWTVSVVGTVGASVIGTIPVTQSGAWNPSAIGYVTRNDTVASFLGADLATRPMMSDSAGRAVIKPFAPEQSRIEGTISLTNTSITTVIAAAGAGLRNYITDFWLANSGSVTTLVTFKDGAGSVLGYSIAPATSGSNSPGIAMPIRTGANATFDIQATQPTSTLYGTFTGFKAP